MAFIFALVFAVLGYAVLYLFDTFLAGDSSGGASEFSSSSSDSASSKKGQTVDIVIQDEDLPVEDGESQYFVGTNRVMLNQDDVTNSKPAESNNSASSAVDEMKNANRSALAGGKTESAQEPSSPGESSSETKFVPVRNMETLYNASGKEAVIKSEELPVQSNNADENNTSQMVKKVSEKFTAADENLDTLPELDGGMFEESDSSIYAGDSAVNTSSDVATVGVEARNIEPDVKDAELMAKAISTILSNEK